MADNPWQSNPWQFTTATWAWTPERLRAADLVAQGYSDRVVAAAIGRTRTAVTNWKAAPAFRARVAELSGALMVACNPHGGEAEPTDELGPTDAAALSDFDAWLARQLGR